jgi:HSP20 family molecular chaperone IbpA
MSRMTTLSSPLLLGFEEIERVLDRVTKSGSDGYPPYNIERIASAGGDRLRITLAVAGFTRDQLSVTVEDNMTSCVASSRGGCRLSRRSTHRTRLSKSFPWPMNWHCAYCSSSRL